MEILGKPRAMLPQKNHVAVVVLAPGTVPGRRQQVPSRRISWRLRLTDARWTNEDVGVTSTAAKIARSRGDLRGGRCRRSVPRRNALRSGRPSGRPSVRPSVRRGHGGPETATTIGITEVLVRRLRQVRSS